VPSGWPCYFAGHGGVRHSKIERATQPALHKPGVSGAIIISVYFKEKSSSPAS
jgi:hypothetical protein